MTCVTLVLVGRVAMCIMTETTPKAVLDNVGQFRKDAMAQLFGSECQHVVIQHLAILKQKLTAEPVLLHLLNLTPSPDRILVKTECCKSSLNHGPCHVKRKHEKSLNENAKRSRFELT